MQYRPVHVGRPVSLLGGSCGVVAVECVFLASSTHETDMIRKVLHSKIHQAVVTEAHPDYQGSLTIDSELLVACGMRASDAILVANCETGARFETYVFSGEPGSGVIGVNGAAAHLASVGDRIIILHWAHLDETEYESHHPRVLVMNKDNSVGEAMTYDPSPMEHC
jgi:aspartate 1-decarboxylase